MWKYDYTTFGIHSHSHWHLWQIQIIKGLQLVSFSNQRFHLRGNTYLIWCEWCKVLQCWEDSEAQTECLYTGKPNLKTAHYSFTFYDFFCNFVHYQGMHGIHQFKNQRLDPKFSDHIFRKLIPNAQNGSASIQPGEKVMHFVVPIIMLNATGTCPLLFFIHLFCV